jgi:6-phosphogluconolactonase
VVQHRGSSIHPIRQTSPHPHSVNLDLDERFLVVPDLGLDRVLVYRFDAESGRLFPNDPPGVAATPGAGPRHLAFHPSGSYAFVVNEIASSLTSYRYAPAVGRLDPLETVATIPPDFIGETFTPDVQVGEAATRPPVLGGNFAADVHVAPSGRFVYASNRGHDSIVVYAFQEGTESLTYVGHVSSGGRVPRGFALDASGDLLLVANQSADSVVTLRLDPETGMASPTGFSAYSPTPTNVLIVDL